MPLPEVAETFDPQKTRFDVVIVDESSQCDPTSLFALYLGRQTIIVGDDDIELPADGDVIGRGHGHAASVARVNDERQKWNLGDQLARTLNHVRIVATPPPLATAFPAAH